MKSKCSCNNMKKPWQECPVHYCVNIEQFGDYRMGLCNEEIDQYLKARNVKNIKNVNKKFSRIAGCNTVAVGPQGQSLMYRWDVKRFADVLFGVTKFTYFD